ncbi:outer membrane protein [Bartonella sp. DGB1]|uniref:outer membrane protein n=1 Tax=Bartonella sp. DGB1 TaxID=3239807 RepID=UPI003524C6FF
MKLKYLSYILLGSVFSMSQVSATTVSKKTDLPKPSNSKVLDNNWSGAYAGLQYSLAINHYKNPWTDIKLFINDDIITDSNNTPTWKKFDSRTNYSYLDGLFLGYNKKINDKWILGVELDASFKLNAGNLHYESYTHPNITSEYKTKPIELPLNRYLNGALRARLGVNLGNFLPYIAGGLNVIYDLPNKEYTDFLPEQSIYIDKTSKSPDYKTTNRITIEGDDKLYLGWNLGAGCEYKLNKYISIRAEYRYSNIISDQKKKIISKTTYEPPKERRKVAQENDSEMVILNYGLDNLSSHDVRLGVSYYF